MKVKKEKEKENDVFRSLEEMKAKLFPNLLNQERDEEARHDAKLLGVVWANESIDAILLP